MAWHVGGKECFVMPLSCLLQVQLFNATSDSAENAAAYDVRVEACKLCFEAALFVDCADLAEGLLAENDNDLQLWYAPDCSGSGPGVLASWCIRLFARVTSCGMCVGVW